MVELIGWFSSVVLVLTLGQQVHKQWKENRSEGVSRWLFVGQLTASAGFTLYSWLVGNAVFVITNGLLLLNALLGLAIVLRHRRRARFEAQLAAERPADAPAPGTVARIEP